MTRVALGWKWGAFGARGSVRTDLPDEDVAPAGKVVGAASPSRCSRAPSAIAPMPYAEPPMKCRRVRCWREGVRPIMLDTSTSSVARQTETFTPSPGTSGEGGGEGDFEHRVLG